MINHLRKVLEKIKKIPSTIRKNTEWFIKNIESVLVQIKGQRGFATVSLSKPKRIGWIPISLFCMSELGTTSDPFSSGSGVGRCSNRRLNSDECHPFGQRYETSLLWRDAEIDTSIEAKIQDFLKLVINYYQRLYVILLNNDISTILETCHRGQ